MIRQMSFALSVSFLILGCSEGDNSETQASKQTTSPSYNDENPTSSVNPSEFSSGAGEALIPTKPLRFGHLTPILSNPIKVYISGDGGVFPGAQKFEKVGPFRSDPGYIKKTLEGVPIDVPFGQVTFFPFDRDVEVTIKTPITITKRIEIYGGRNVVVRGEGSGDIYKALDVNMPAYCDPTSQQCKDTLKAYRPTVPEVLRIDSPRQSAVIENLKIHVNGDFTDAIVFRQNPNTFDKTQKLEDFPGIDIFVRNFGAYDIGGAGDGLHGDIVQLQNGIFRNMFFENIDGTTGYQGFFLPQRPQGPKDNPYLCSVISDINPETKKPWNIKHCFSPITVKGKSFFENVVLRTIDPKICPHCPIPYRGIYTKDPDKTEVIDEKKVVTFEAPDYISELQNVTFFTDPRPHKRNELPLYVMPQPRYGTPEGTINMSKATNDVIKGQLNILSTNYFQAKDALLKSNWRAGSPSGELPFKNAPEVSCKKSKKIVCKASFYKESRKIIFVINAEGEGDQAKLTIVGAHY